jgi:hypothetical protein
MTCVHLGNSLRSNAANSSGVLDMISPPSATPFSAHRDFQYSHDLFIESLDNCARVPAGASMPATRSIQPGISLLGHGRHIGSMRARFAPVVAIPLICPLL